MANIKLTHSGCENEHKILTNKNSVLETMQKEYMKLIETHKKSKHDIAALEKKNFDLVKVNTTLQHNMKTPYYVIYTDMPCNLECLYETDAVPKNGPGLYKINRGRYTSYQIRLS